MCTLKTRKEYTKKACFNHNKDPIRSELGKIIKFESDRLNLVLIGLGFFDMFRFGGLASVPPVSSLLVDLSK